MIDKLGKFIKDLCSGNNSECAIGLKMANIATSGTIDLNGKRSNDCRCLLGKSMRCMHA